MTNSNDKATARPWQTMLFSLLRQCGVDRKNSSRMVKEAIKEVEFNTSLNAQAKAYSDGFSFSQTINQASK